MLFNRHERPSETKDLAKSALKPALYDPPGSAGKSAGSRGGLSPQTAPAKDAAPNDGVAPTAGVGSHVALSADAAGSRLFIGVNIKLKGVEISDCDVLVIEGHVEA